MSTHATFPCRHCSYRWTRASEFQAHLAGAHPEELDALIERVGVPVHGRRVEHTTDPWSDEARALDAAGTLWGAPVKKGLFR